MLITPTFTLAQTAKFMQGSKHWENKKEGLVCLSPGNACSMQPFSTMVIQPVLERKLWEANKLRYLQTILLNYSIPYCCTIPC